MKDANSKIVDDIADVIGDLYKKISIQRKQMKFYRLVIWLIIIFSTAGFLSYFYYNWITPSYWAKFFLGTGYGIAWAAAIDHLFTRLKRSKKLDEELEIFERELKKTLT